MYVFCTNHLTDDGNVERLLGYGYEILYRELTFCIKLLICIGIMLFLSVCLTVTSAYFTQGGGNWQCESCDFVYWRFQ